MQSIVEPNAKNKLKSSILFHCVSASYEFSFGKVIKEQFQREGKMMQKHDPLARTFFENVLWMHFFFHFSVKHFFSRNATRISIICLVFSLFGHIPPRLWTKPKSISFIYQFFSFWKTRRTYYALYISFEKIVIS